jgi:glycerol-3-phosphate acyltransferase PlsX
MVQGAIDFARQHPEHQVILVGQSSVVEASLAAESSHRPANILVRDAPQVIDMAAKIAALKENPDDSMQVCARMVRHGEADAMVLCGNTACSVAASQLHLGRIPGVKRAGILTPLPNPTGSTWVCDCGANSVCKPDWLVQFAEMTCAFLKCYQGWEKPRVGVLSIGAEEGKGDSLTTEVLDLLRQTDLEVVGNVEGNDIFKGTSDIVVCDGFTGNVLLKTAEGVSSIISRILKDSIGQSLRCRLGAWLMLPAFNQLRERTSWAKVGGCLLLGVNGITIIGHGRSRRDAVESALLQAARCVTTDVLSGLRRHIQSLRTTV